jgi:polygalacturonase
MALGKLAGPDKSRAKQLLVAACALWGALGCSSKPDVASPISASGGVAALSGGQPGDAAGGDPGSGGASEASGGNASGGSSASGGAAVGTGGSGSGGTPAFSATCDDLGPEPTIPPACATLAAPKTATNGVLDDDSTLDTSTIQDAIDACPAGQSVQLVTDGARNAFVSGALFLRNGVTLWLDAGVTLYASHNPRDFDAKAGQCGLNGSNGNCYALINATAVLDAGVMGAGAIDGRGGEPVTGDTRTWWELETVYDGGLAAPRLIQTGACTNFTIYQITLRNAPKFHVGLTTTNGFKVWGITINTPDAAPNTDGIDPYASRNGIIAYNKITTGDDNIAIKGSGAVTNLVIAHNHFGTGHGMSIGSETYGGVSNVQVCDLSLDGTHNGLRIKSDSSCGGPVQGITYTDVCMRAVAHPLVFTPYYSSDTGTMIPDYRQIALKNVRILGTSSSSSILRGYDAAHPLTISFDNVVFDNPTGATFTTLDAQISLGPGPVNFTPTGSNVVVTSNITGTDPPRACDDAWVTF